MWQNATMCAGHGLCKQFTILFLFLQKWVWLARLTAAVVPASFRFQEFKSSNHHLILKMWSQLWQFKVETNGASFPESFFTNIATKTLTTKDDCWFADCSFWSCTQQLPQNEEGSSTIEFLLQQNVDIITLLWNYTCCHGKRSQQIWQHTTVMVIHRDSLSIAAWPDPSSLCEECGLWDYLLVSWCKEDTTEMHWYSML